MTFSRRLLVLGLMAPLILSLSASPALAAAIIQEIKVQNVSFPVEDSFKLPNSICGVQKKNLSGDFVFNELHIVVWDSGHFVLTTTNSVNLIDSNGNPVLRDRFAASEIQGEGGLPQSFQSNLVSHCTPESPTPGVLVNVHFGFTIGEDGAFKEFHGTICDPSVYAFC